MKAFIILVLLAQVGILGTLFKLDRRMRCMGITQTEAVERLDALTAKTEKVFTEVQAVKQALGDLRNSPGTLTPEAEAALVRAEEAIGRVDEINEDATDPV